MNNNIEFFWRTWADLSIDDYHDAVRLREKIFVVEQDCVYADADGQDPRCHHLFYYAQNYSQRTLAGYLRLVPPGDRYSEWSISRVVTGDQFRNCGYGRNIMKIAIKKVVSFGKHLDIRISGQSYLKKFYESFAFEVVGKEYLEDDIPHFEMLRKHEG